MLDFFGTPRKGRRMNKLYPDAATALADIVKDGQTMAVEWGKFGINVNAICPGYIETEINEDHFRTEQGKKLIDMLPRKRVGAPEDLDGLLLLLAAEESRFINGAIMSADDGLSAS